MDIYRHRHIHSSYVELARAPLSGCNPSGSADPSHPYNARWLSSQTFPKHPESERENMGELIHRIIVLISTLQFSKERSKQALITSLKWPEVNISTHLYNQAAKVLSDMVKSLRFCGWLISSASSLNCKVPSLSILYSCICTY